MTEQQQLIPLHTGERLRQERLKLRISQQDIASKLNIDLPVVESIEEDKLDHLAPVYHRGYISAYARYLGFEPSDIEQMLDAIGNEEPELHTVFPEAGNPKQADRWLKASSYVLASLLVGTLAWQFTHEAVRLSQSGPDLATGNTLPVDQPADSNSVAAPQSGSATHVNASIAALDILKQQKESRNAVGREAWAALQGGKETEAAKTALIDGQFTLDLTASGDSWVEISDAEGNQLELDLIRAGSSKQYVGTAPFSVQFGRASAITLHVDGKAVDLSPYTIGDVTQMILDGSGNSTAVVEKDSGSS